MEDWQQRVVDDQRDLEDKIKKLEAFIDGDKFGSVRSAVRVAMREQHRHMVGYNRALVDRISLFESA